MNLIIKNIQIARQRWAGLKPTTPNAKEFRKANLSAFDSITVNYMTRSKKFKENSRLLKKLNK